jgi:putative tryptophan/tyrosine transport system substrate-binding protein
MMSRRAELLRRLNETARVHRSSRQHRDRVARLFERRLVREGLASWHSWQRARGPGCERAGKAPGRSGVCAGQKHCLSQSSHRPGLQGVENAILSILPNIDLLIVGGTVGGVAAKKLVATKPVVFIAVGAPVEIGLVESLSRPGGNMTGITFEAATETYAKRLQILKEIVPKVNRVAVLHAPGDANVKFAMASLEGAAPNLGIQLSPIPISSSSDIAAAFDEMRQSQSEALIVIAGLLTYRNGQQIADLALAHHLPSCHAFRETVAMGGLVSLGPDITALWGQAAGFIDQIIRGSQPRELPVQQPTRYELAINLKTAKALGLTLPPSLLAGADVVIE